MARRVKDARIESREARSKLKPSGVPYWRAIDRGLHLGYRKGQSGGVWVVRRYDGTAYTVKNIAKADDRQDANGDDVLDFWQAQERARGGVQQRVAHSASAYTVADAIRDYLKLVEGRPTYIDIANRLTVYALPAFGDKPVASITAEMLREWLLEMSRQGARTRTANGAKQNYRKADDSDPEVIRKRQASANRIAAQLLAVLRFAVDEKKAVGVDTNEWRRVKLFRGVDTARIRYLAVDECQRLINASEGDFRTLVRGALYTGARYQELARLTVADFNPDSKTLHIRKSKVGKDRHVHLNPEGQRFFFELTAGRAGEELLLGREWGRNHQQYQMRIACKRAGLKYTNFHALRHTYASLSVMAGVPLIVVAKNLGHSDTRMVEKHYGHLAESYIAEAIRNGAPRFGSFEGDGKVKRLA